METKVKDPNRVKAGKRSKAKGAGFELKIAKELELWWGRGARFRRTPGSGGWARAAENMDGFNSAGDIVCSDKSFPLCVELKFYADWQLEHLIVNEKPPILEWWQQAVDQTPVGSFPLLIFKKNNTKPLVMFSYQRFPDHNTTVAEMLHGKRFFRLHGLDETLVILSLQEFLVISPETIALEAPNAAL